MKKFAMILAVMMLVLSYTQAQQVSHTFHRARAPQSGYVYLQGVNFAATQSIDVDLPSNLRYTLERVYVRTTAASAITNAAALAVTEVTALGVEVGTALYANTLSTAAVAGTLENLTPRVSTAAGTGFTRIPKPAAATVTGAFTTVTDLTATNVQTIAAEDVTDPVWPRNAVFVVTDTSGASTNLSGYVTVAGTDVAGNTVSETLTKAAGTTATLTGSVAFKTVTSVQHLFQNGAVEDTLAMGYGVKLGLPVDTRVQKVTGVLASYKDGVADAVSALGTTYGTVTMTTAPNATNNYEVVYAFGGAGKQTPVDGSNRLRIGVTGSSSGTDVKDVVLQLSAY